MTVCVLMTALTLLEAFELFRLLRVGILDITTTSKP
jgi:hypothetical protein